MAQTWNVTKLRENLAQALESSKHSPQTIVVAGEPKAVIISIEQWEQLSGQKQRKKAWAKYKKDLESFRADSIDDKEANATLPRFDWKRD